MKSTTKVQHSYLVTRAITHTLNYLNFHLLNEYSWTTSGQQRQQNQEDLESRNGSKPCSQPTQMEKLQCSSPTNWPCIRRCAHRAVRHRRHVRHVRHGSTRYGARQTRRRRHHPITCKMPHQQHRHPATSQALKEDGNKLLQQEK